MVDTWMSVLVPTNATCDAPSTRRAPGDARPFVRRTPGDDEHGWLLSLIALAFLAGTIWLYWMRTGH